jgi:hypothetical protein
MEAAGLTEPWKAGDTGDCASRLHGPFVRILNFQSESVVGGLDCAALGDDFFQTGKIFDVVVYVFLDFGVKQNMRHMDEPCVFCTDFFRGFEGLVERKMRGVRFGSESVDYKMNQISCIYVNQVYGRLGDAAAVGEVGDALPTGVGVFFA